MHTVFHTVVVSFCVCHFPLSLSLCNKNYYHLIVLSTLHPVALLWRREWFTLSSDLVRISLFLLFQSLFIHKIKVRVSRWVLVVVFCYAVCTRKNWYFRENQSIVIFKDDLKEEFIIKIKKNGFCSNMLKKSQQHLSIVCGLIKFW